MVVAQQDGVKVRVIRLGSKQQRVWRTPAPPVLILMKLTYLMSRRWIKNKLLSVLKALLYSLLFNFQTNNTQPLWAKVGSCEKERYIAHLITRKTRGKRSWRRNSAFIKRWGRGCRKDRPAAATLLQDTVGKGVCLRCAGQQTDHPQEKKKMVLMKCRCQHSHKICPPTSRLDPPELMKEHTVGWSAWL